MPRRRQAQKKTNQEDEASKNTAPTPIEALPAQTFDEYQCSGNVTIDFPALCALVNVKDIPDICTKHPASCIAETEGRDTEDNQSQINDASYCSKPCVEVELETEDPLSVKTVKVSGWKVKEQIFQVLLKMLPSMSQLHGFHFWQAGLTDQMVISLMNTISLSCSLRAVTLEGNVLPERSFHLLLSEDSILTHLSLRNNHIGDEGACLIGAALSTARSANNNLLSLNLAFNCIADAGAIHIAQGLRLNRTLLFLSLCNNHIGDSGAAQLAMILGEFALTHEEVVERRKLLLQRTQTASLRANSDQLPTEQLTSVPDSASQRGVSRKDEKPADNKEKPNKKSPSDVKVAQAKGRKPQQKETPSSAQEDETSSSLNKDQAELVERVHPLLDKLVHRRDGQLFLPGNSTLTSLNLAGNKITEKSLPLFLASLKMQDERGSLLRLCLQRNLFPSECEHYMKIKEWMGILDPLTKKSSKPTEGKES